MRFGLKTITLAASLSLLAGCTAAKEPEPETPARFESLVGVQLFMWNWNSIAKECEFLGQAGIDWVLTSPPQEHIAGGQWWTVYQPVSYQLEGRLGSREEFQNMTSSCAEHGVEIIADAVINHMSGQASGTGSAGTEFVKYEHPMLYTSEDFHDCNLTATGQIENYMDANQVQSCELLGLADLDTANPKVQKTIVTYLTDLLSLGVAGFRIDAAKHISPDDLLSIVEQLPENTRVIQEVIRGSGEPIQPEQYLASGEVWDFDFARNLKSFFYGELGITPGQLSRELNLTPSNQTVTFVSNHDTERNGQTLSYLEARQFELATALMLAEDFGQPMLLSSYAFEDFDQGPEQDSDRVSDANCAAVLEPSAEYQTQQWVCQHRWQSILNMIEFRKFAGDAPIIEKLAEPGTYAFARSERGFFAINLFEVRQVELETTLPDGEYTDLIDGGNYEIVNGILKTTLEPMSAIALLVEP